MEGLKDQLILVTGASGFVGSHCVKRLLEVGAKVRGTVRSLQNEDKVNFLKELPNANERLELVEADLDKPDSWISAVKNCKYVLHVASPFPPAIPKNPDEVIKPAVEGTLCVLKACSKEPSVKRVVVTSSVFAVYDAAVPLPKNSNNKTLDETFWTNPDDKKIEPYSRSKVLAEKAAWDYVNSLEEKTFELVTLNPGLILGPLLNRHSDSTSISVIKKLMERSVPACAKMILPITDVRDVAECHLKALVVKEAAGKRHLICTNSLWMKEAASILKNHLHDYDLSVPTMTVPNIFVWINGFWNGDSRLVAPRLGREYYLDNSRMKNVLGVKPRSEEETIKDTATSLINLGIVLAAKKIIPPEISSENQETIGEQSSSGEVH